MNDKKLFPEKKMSRKKLLEFVEKKGFYIVLILCVVIVGATAYILATRSVSSPSTDLDTKIIPDASEMMKTPADTATKAPISTPAVTENKSVAANVGKETPQTGKTPAETPKSAEPVKKTPPAPSKTTKSTKPAPKTEKFARPVFGDITLEFAQDKLVFSKTLGEWRAHSGIDLAADRGTSVKAAGDGVVSEVKTDPRFGIMVIIDHQNGIKTVYANLASDDVVAPNQKIKMGDVIGTVGDTATFETIEASHLHFEVLKNNKPVDPTAYLPK